MNLTSVFRNDDLFIDAMQGHDLVIFVRQTAVDDSNIVRDNHMFRHDSWYQTKLRAEEEGDHRSASSMDETDGVESPSSICPSSHSASVPGAANGRLCGSLASDL